MIKKVAIASGIGFTVDVAPLGDLFSKESEISFYRIVQECVNNIVKHSGATEAAVSISLSGHNVLLQIKDNGKGFTVELNESSEPGRSGFGLVGLSERVRILAGTHSIKSGHGLGTAVFVSIAANKGQEHR
ncbi:MAG: sensor histidine kinase [Blastocatellia bacterium]